RRLSEPERLERVWRPLGHPRMDVAVAARPRAGVAEDLERRGASAPALGNVGAARLLTHRVQALSLDQLPDVEVAAVRARRAPFHPLGAAWRAGAGGRAFHPRLCPRTASRWCTGCGQSPWASSAGSSSSSRPNTSATAAVAAGRTSATATGRPSSSDIVVNVASSSPQAAIQLVNRPGARSTVTPEPCVVTHRETWTPIDAILRGPEPFPGGIHTPVSPSMRVASSAKAASVWMIACSRLATYRFTSLP